MGLGCRCKVVNGGSVMSPQVEVAWISDEEKKKKLSKLTLDPKMHQNASFGPWKWWMWWVWVVIGRWWKVVVLCHFVELKLEVAWVSNEKKKKKLRKITLGPKMHQNALFGPQK